MCGLCMRRVGAVVCAQSGPAPGKGRRRGFLPKAKRGGRKCGKAGGRSCATCHGISRHSSGEPAVIFLEHVRGGSDSMALCARAASPSRPPRRSRRGASVRAGSSVPGGGGVRCGPEPQARRLVSRAPTSPPSPTDPGPEPGGHCHGSEAVMRHASLPWFPRL